MATDETVRASGAVVPEGASPMLLLPKGLRRAPQGVDEVATEHLVINCGPQHPSTHGVLRVLLELDGESVIAAEAALGYLHRGIEKLAEHRRYHQVGTLMDRSDYLSGIHTETAFAMAAEQLGEVEVPEKAQWIRALVMEVNRIASHALFIGTFAMDTGAMAPFLYAMREREVMLDVLQELSGQRMTFNYVRPGGVAFDLTPGIDNKIRAFLDTYDKYVDEYEVLLGGNEIFQVRCKNVGVIDAETAVAFGLTGGCLRASGVNFDVRKAIPYGPYPQLKFEVPLGTVGDCWDRYQVRLDEMRWAGKLLRQIVDGMPEGDYKAKIPKVFRPPAGEAYASVESPRGELGIHLVSDGSDKPYRVRVRPPCLYNLAVIDEALAGGLVADAIIIIGSLDFVLGEIDR